MRHIKVYEVIAMVLNNWEMEKVGDCIACLIGVGNASRVTALYVYKVARHAGDILLICFFSVWCDCHGTTCQ